MKNSNLISLLQSLNADEFKRLGDFIHSPFHNSNKNCVSLYKYLKPYYPNFDAKEIDKTRIGIKLFGSKEKADKNLAFLMTVMSNLVQDFFVVLQLEENPNVGSTLLLKSLSERGLKQYFIGKYKTAIENIDKQAESSVSYFGDKYEKLSLLQEFNELNKDNTISIDLQNIADTFYKHSILQQLHIASIIVNKATITSIEYDVQAIEELLRDVENKHFLSETIIELYCHSLKLLLDNLHGKPDEDNNFVLLKQSLSVANGRVLPEELYNFYAYAHSYCNRQVHKGREGFRKEAFELYRQQLAQNALERNGYVVPANVRNIVTLGLWCNEAEWVYAFIEDIKEKIAPKFRNDIYHLNLGAYYFFKKDYESCLDKLAGVEKFIAPIYQVEAKSLMLKSYYELEEGWAFESLIDSFREYIKYQKELPEQRKNAYLNFINFAQKLHKKRQYRKVEPNGGVQDVLLEMKDCDNISERKWLLDKIAAF